MTGADRWRGLATTSAVGALLAAPVALSIGYGCRAARRDLARHPLQGSLVDVGGYSLHARTTGLDLPGPVVLFESGLAWPQDTWAWIQPEVARIAPTVSYDRAGLGGSDRGPKPRTARLMVDELDRLLDAIDVPGPYVLVGHSFGGLLVRAFADRHPDLVAGIVLVDASHPDQFERSRQQRHGLPLMRMQLQQAATAASLGFNRIFGTPPMAGIQMLPNDDYQRARARMLTAKACRTACDELEGWVEHVNDEVRQAALPAGCPLAVVTAGDVVDQDPVHGQLQVELAALSTRGTCQRIDGVDHAGLLTNEAYAVHVTRAVRDVVALARNKVKTNQLSEPSVPHEEKP